MKPCAARWPPASPMSLSTSSRTPTHCKQRSSGGCAANRRLVRSTTTGRRSKSAPARCSWSAIPSRRSIASAAPTWPPTSRRARRFSRRPRTASCRSRPTSAPAQPILRYVNDRFETPALDRERSAGIHRARPIPSRARRRARASPLSTLPSQMPTARRRPSSSATAKPRLSPRCVRG